MLNVSAHFLKICPVQLNAWRRLGRKSGSFPCLLNHWCCTWKPGFQGWFKWVDHCLGWITTCLKWNRSSAWMMSWTDADDAALGRTSFQPASNQLPTSWCNVPELDEGKMYKNPLELLGKTIFLTPNPMKNSVRWLTWLRTGRRCSATWSMTSGVSPNSLHFPSWAKKKQPAMANSTDLKLPKDWCTQKLTQ